MVTLTLKSLQQWTVERLLEQGFKRIDSETFEKIDGNTRFTAKYSGGDFLFTVDMLVGIRVIDLENIE